ncbi:MAG: FlgD immunoglobulin-like domain containing protein [Candidatus Latescibacterota bacterium]
MTPTRCCFPAVCTGRGRALAAAALALSLFAAPVPPVAAGTWRMGDVGHPWVNVPVSFQMDAGYLYRPDWTWGGGWATEVIVDDDGDGVADEDGFDYIDNDGDILYNEDPPDGIDNDHDGLIDEDGADPQLDNDGDGLVNEDPRLTGGVCWDPDMRSWLAADPFWRYPTQRTAESDSAGWGARATGWGWGNDDQDGKFNEDPLDGVDNDRDGLIDEDPAGPGYRLPASWQRWAFQYDTDQVDQATRRRLRFVLDPAGQSFTALRVDARGDTSAVLTAGGDTLKARRTRLTFTPADFLRPIRLDSLRNLNQVTASRHFQGEFKQSPFDAQYYGTTQPTLYHTPSGYGQIVDGNIFTARVESRRISEAGFRAETRGVFLLDRVVFRPRPDFPDRTAHTFNVRYTGNGREDYVESGTGTEYTRRMTVSRFLVPRQVDWFRPAIKDIRLDGGEFGDPVEVRLVDVHGDMPEGFTWELAEVQYFGQGYARDAYYVSEVMDVGSARPQVRRYWDSADPERPILFESVRTTDSNGNGTIDAAELARTRLKPQFDDQASGQPVTWGRVRWRGTLEGSGGDVQVRMRAGTTPDPYIFMRTVGPGVYSPYIETPAVLDWPARGERIDAYSYVAMRASEQAAGRALPYNTLSEADGAAGGWSFWSVPLNFADGLVDEQGRGGALMPLPPLTRYVQFRFDFVTPQTGVSGVALDYVEFEFFTPYVRGGVLAEVFPDTLSAEGDQVPIELGKPFPFQYVLRPDFQSGQETGFNRVDIAIPSLDTRVEQFLFDGNPWRRIEPEVPAGLELTEAARAAYLDSLGHSKAWLDGLQITQSGVYAAVTYLDPESRRLYLALKTRQLTPGDFPQGQGRDVEVYFRSPLYALLTEFSSWIWTDTGTEGLRQATTPGNASNALPLDVVTVAAGDIDRPVEMTQVAPNPFSPNGDGLNDALLFDFELFLLTENVATEVVIHDLSGRAVRHLGEAQLNAGSHQVRWDGKDDNGQVVPPGVYLYRLAVESDTERSKVRTGLVGVAY